MKRSAWWLNLPPLPAWYRELSLLIQFRAFQRCPPSTFKAVHRVTSSFVSLKCLESLPHRLVCESYQTSHPSVLTIIVFYTGCKLSQFSQNNSVPLIRVQFITTKGQLWYTISTQDSLIGRLCRNTDWDTNFAITSNDSYSNSRSNGARQFKVELFRCCFDWRQPFTWWCLEANRIIYFLFERLRAKQSLMISSHSISSPFLHRVSSSPWHTDCLDADSIFVYCLKIIVQS